MLQEDEDPTPYRWRLGGKMDGLADGAGYSVDRDARQTAKNAMTPGQFHRWEKQVVMTAAFRQGVPVRMIARAFRLAYSHVWRIIEAMEGPYGGKK